MFSNISELHHALNCAIKDELPQIVESANRVVSLEPHYADLVPTLRLLLSTDIAGVNALISGYFVHGVGAALDDGDSCSHVLRHVAGLSTSPSAMPAIEWATALSLVVDADVLIPPDGTEYLYARVVLALSARRRVLRGLHGAKWVNAARALIMYCPEDWYSQFRLLVPLLTQLTYVDGSANPEAVVESHAPGEREQPGLVECIRLAALGQMSLSHPHMSHFSPREICDAIEAVFVEEF